MLAENSDDAKTPVGSGEASANQRAAQLPLLCFLSEPSFLSPEAADRKLIKLINMQVKFI